MVAEGVDRPQILRSSRLDQAGNWRGLVQVVLRGQVVHHKLLPGRPDQTAADRDAERYDVPWDEFLTEDVLATGQSTTSAELRQDGPPPQTSEEPPELDGPDDLSGDDPKPATAAKVKAVFEEEREYADRLAEIRSDREVACFEAHEAGWTYSEIAEMVGVSHQTISQLARREKLRRLGEDHDNEEGDDSDGASGLREQGSGDDGGE